MGGNGKPFSKDDLILLLESYQQQVESNRTLMELQSKLLEQHNAVLTKQQKICDTVNKVLDKVGDSSLKTIEMYTKGQLQCFKDHSGIKIKLYGLYAGIASIIIVLINLLYDAHNKFEILTEIAKKLGV